MKNFKKSSKFGIAKFLVVALVIGGGLIYGVGMVQKNQENRSKAAAPKECSSSNCNGCSTKSECLAKNVCQWDSKNSRCLSKTGETRCTPNDSTYLLRQIKYTGSNGWVSYVTCSDGTYCVNKNDPGFGVVAACLLKKEIGKDCVKDYECKSGKCSNKKCVKTVSACSDGATKCNPDGSLKRLVCKGGVWVNWNSCSSSNEYCQTRYQQLAGQTAFCFVKKDKGKVCSSNYECNSGECSNKKCK